MLVQGSELSVLCKLGVAIDGNNHEVKERHIHLVKKRGKVKALDEELYSK
jgi:glucosamine--fructose-6-phosphate aminotransferase (isomerizing)